MTNYKLKLLLIALSGLILSGCLGLTPGGRATNTMEERTLGTMVDDEVVELKALSRINDESTLGDKVHINVTSFNFIVLLSGEAPTEFARTKAMEIVRKVPKVRRIHNKITVAAPSAILSRTSDSVVTATVKSLMLQDKSLDAKRVKIVTEKGTVYLMGMVSQHEARIATSIARSTNGVERVVKLFEYLD